MPPPPPPPPHQKKTRKPVKLHGPCYTRCLLPLHITISPGACCLHIWFHQVPVALIRTSQFHQVPIDFTHYTFTKCLLISQITSSPSACCLYTLGSHKKASCLHTKNVCFTFLFFTWVYVSIKCNNSFALFISDTVLLSTSVKIHSHIKSMDINADNFCAWCQTQIPE